MLPNRLYVRKYKRKQINCEMKVEKLPTNVVQNNVFVLHFKLSLDKETN